MKHDSKKCCCELMELALSRARDADRTGLKRTWTISLTGGLGELIVVRIHKAKRGDHSPHADVAVLVVNYCPFCGTPVTGKRKKK